MTDEKLSLNPGYVVKRRLCADGGAVQLMGRVLISYLYIGTHHKTGTLVNEMDFIKGGERCQ